MEIKAWEELQNLLIPLSSQEKSALIASISEHGVLDPILVLPDGRIIDGANRWEISNGKAPYNTLDIDNETALALGVTINIARRQMSPEQIKELQKRLKKDRAKLRKLALKLRKTHKTQEEVAAIVGVPRTTLEGWEQGVSIDESVITYALPDVRIKVPKDEYQTIYKRVKAGEPQGQVAADYKLSRPRVNQIAKQVEKQNQATQERKELVDKGADLVPPEGVRIEDGDFRVLGEGIPVDSIDLIFTDPPYGEEYKDLWGSLAELAARVLKPGALLLTYSGQILLPEIMEIFKEHLTFYWVAGIYHTGGHQQIWSRKVWNQWKPILIYSKLPLNTEHREWLLDMIQGGGREKELDEWQQSITEASYYIERLTKENDIILDPFCGSGTIPVAIHSLKPKRKVIGFDIDKEKVQLVRGRLVK